MGSDDEGVSILAQQRLINACNSVFPLQLALVGVSELVPVAPISSITLS